MSAALFAAISGARTLLVEKSGFVGGTRRCRRDQSGYRIRVHASGVSDSAANVERYLQQIVGNRADANLRAAFLNAGPKRSRCWKTIPT
jgi:phytoene dehydrogenase-like protein